MSDEFTVKFEGSTKAVVRVTHPDRLEGLSYHHFLKLDRDNMSHYDRQWTVEHTAWAVLEHRPFDEFPEERRAELKEELIAKLNGVRAQKRLGL